MQAQKNSQHTFVTFTPPRFYVMSATAGKKVRKLKGNETFTIIIYTNYC